MKRVAGKDAIFLYMETPTNHSTMAFVGVFDPSTVPGGLSGGQELYAHMYQLLSDRLHLFPPFRQRLAEVPFQLHHPMFVEDAGFDLDFHLRRAALPAPGGRHELASFVGDIVSRPLDRNHPLWEIYVVEGLEEDRWALIAKAHHTIVDGIGGREILVNLLDLTPEVRAVDPPDKPWLPEESPSDMRLLSEALLANAMSPPRVVKATVKTARTLMSALLESRRNEESFATLGPKTILNNTVSSHRTVGFERISLDDVKTVKNAFGVKVNDVVLAMCGRALRRFLAELGDEPDSQLVAAVPISVRTDEGQELGNQVSGMTVPMADDAEDPAEQLQRINAVAGVARERHGALAAQAMMEWPEFTTPTLAVQAFRFYSALNVGGRHRPIANVTISNVPGPPFPLYVAGSRMEGMYPLGPVIHGQALNITVVSYCDEMHLGVIADAGVVADVTPLTSAMEKALAELVSAAEQRS